VDDILCMSKLDSNLLIITPVAVQPTKIVQDSVNMLASEARSAHITMKLNIESSYKDLAVDWVLLDPSRLTQVLINLVTNAIKFTASRPERRVTVSIGASTERPSKVNESTDNEIRYVSTKSQPLDSTAVSGPSWGAGEILYIHISVHDTGRGLAGPEKELLFQRFSQASPRTHVQYGGSGLGLFISRTLAEMQGGEIGVASESGVGSTFAFYVMTRRTTKPDVTPTAANSPSPMVTPQNGVKDRSASSTPLESASLPMPLVSEVLAKAGSEMGEEGVKRPLSVLIVEDNLINQSVLRKSLTMLGWTVHVANHGLEALDFLKTTRYYRTPNPSESAAGDVMEENGFQDCTGRVKDGLELDVVLMDQEMPIMDGLTCVKRIREMEANGELVVGENGKEGSIKVVAVTANAREEQVRVLAEGGCVSNLFFSPSDFVECG
jgi:CheY-like chemotaxis protein